MATLQRIIVPLICFLFFLSMLQISCNTFDPDTDYLTLPCIDLKGNETFQANVKAVLSNLTSHIIEDDGFSDDVVGWGSPFSVHGQSLCRGDLNPKACKECVKHLVKETLRRCPHGSEYAIYNELCMVRYNGRAFDFNNDISKERNSIFINVMTNNTDNSYRKHLNESMWELLSYVAAKAANSTVSNKRFATHEVPFLSNQKLYGLAQCVPIITASSCANCFKVAFQQYWKYCHKIKNLCDSGIARIRIVRGNCAIRAEMHPFYNITNIKVPSPSMLPPTPSPSMLPPTPSHVLPSPSSGKKYIRLAIVVAVVSGAVTAFIALIYCRCCDLRRRERRKIEMTILRENLGEEGYRVEPLKFKLGTIKVATNNFSVDNRIGRGGFGEVYKGTFADGREIAVKRLARGSRQGKSEFRSEVLLTVQLQHVNLVSLLGFCIEGEEKILVYQYVPNRSLDYFLFDSERRRLLNWPDRLKIIRGIAQGLAYLHRISGLEIIHRDIKTSNILLDNEMNAKISDFGMARIAKGLAHHTGTIVGTKGYIPPEYLLHGQYSEKSDVFSFGIIVLEVISGSRNNNESQLISDVWKHWNASTPLQVLDPDLMASSSQTEVIKCVQIGLLCVEENSEERPTMVQVDSYLRDLSTELPIPRKPAFVVHDGGNAGPSIAIESSVNEISDYESLLYPR